MDSIGGTPCQAMQASVIDTTDPYLVSLLFADLLSLHLITFLTLLVLLISLFLSSRYMLELKFIIYHRVANLSSQASSVDEWHNG